MGMRLKAKISSKDFVDGALLEILWDDIAEAYLDF
jgi:hypothetical protein